MMTQTSQRWFDSVRATTKDLLAIPSVSPSADGENRCAEKIAELLTTGRDSLRPVFWDTGDGRKSVACLLKSRHPRNTGKTIVLMSHFDTVGVDDFARFGNTSIAFDPDALAKEMRASLEAKMKTGGLEASEKSAFEALRSGEWMFGRGSVDMKSGVAINIELMREFARPLGNGQRLIDNLAGNLLFLSCPDEETESAGILSAVPELLKHRDAENLTYLGMVNTDYTAPRDADASARYIYSGTIGKLLPSFYILGVRTHVGEIFRGVDAAHIAAELVSRINLNPEWVDVWRGELGGEKITEVAPPPVALQMRDLKPSYNVETAGDAFVYVNWLTLTITPEQALEKMKTAASAALASALQRIEAAFAEFEARGGQAVPPPVRTPNVLDYASLFREAQARWEAANQTGQFTGWLASKAEEFKSLAGDGRELSRMIVAELARVAQLSGPAVIAFFSPPYYPSVSPRENELMHALKFALARQDQPIQFRGFYPYISDLSYVRLDDGIEVDSVKKNMPLFDLRGAAHALFYALDSAKWDDIRALDCPVVNLGPFGSDAHGLHERVHMPYSFESVPQIIFETIHQALERN